MTHLILVLGMHRSGTSLVAKSLECLGAERGPLADWSGPDNPKGFAEDQEVLALNSHIMRHLGSAWDNPIPIGDVKHWMNANVDAAYDVAMLLQDRLQRYPIFALKEPRMCRLLPLWRWALRIVGCKVSVVHVVRHPADVAASLLRRNGIPIGKGFALWLEYVRCQFADVDPAWPSVTVGYDQMMTFPQDVVRRIGNALNLEVDQAALELFAQDFVDQSLWHEGGKDAAPLPIKVAATWSLVTERTKA